MAVRAIWQASVFCPRFAICLFFASLYVAAYGDGPQGFGKSLRQFFHLGWSVYIFRDKGTVIEGVIDRPWCFPRALSLSVFFVFFLIFAPSSQGNFRDVFHLSENFSDLSPYILERHFIYKFLLSSRSSLSISYNHLQRPLLESHLSLPEAVAVSAASVPGVGFSLFMFSLAVVKPNVEFRFSF